MDDTRMLEQSERKEKHLSKYERGQIAALHSQGYTPYKIGKLMGRASNTIRNELQRGTTIQIKGGFERKCYIPELGQLTYEKHRKNSKKHIKGLVGRRKHFLNYVEKMVLKDKYSLEQARGRLLHLGTFKLEDTVCVKTLYNYVSNGIMRIKNIDLSLKTKRKITKRNKVRKHKRLKGMSIEQRQKEIDTRSSFGHWEIDLVIGKNGKSEPTLLTLTERKTRVEFIEKLAGKTVNDVHEGLNHVIERIKQTGGKIKSITTDNGVEFSHLYELEEKGIQVFYAHPYSSWERGTNERNNGLIRRLIPKRRSFRNYTPDYIQKVEDWVNNMPRKILNYATAWEVYQAESLLEA